ncbi:MAG: TrkA C-terminal domain-containing protein [Acidimicrobiales bacterium]
MYRSQLRTRADSEASRLQFGLPLLNLVQVANAATLPKVLLRDDAPLPEALGELRAAGVPGAPVVDEGGWYLGTVDLQKVVRLLEPPGVTGRAAEEGAVPEGAVPEGAVPALTVAAAVDRMATSVPDTARLNVALEALLQAGGEWVTVTSARRVVGVLSIGDVVRGYQHALAASAGQISAVSPSAVTIEERVGADSPIAGVLLRAAGLPPGFIIVSVQRAEHMLFATGSTALEPGDLVSALANPTTVESARRMIRGTDEPKPPMVERGSHMV